ncbi:MAG: nucleoid occlusion factor SlmA [Gammaproteobacteria bacterium]|nr:nucleoid occlusion factor SlmA [Gammaproteobacteria bacterium]
MKSPNHSVRGKQILEALARELENNPGIRITTATLAKAVGLSEAALYRHFPSKAKMFEALLEFTEDSVFSLLNRAHAESTDLRTRCEVMMRVLLGFAERNPGISRILLGDALVGENERLRVRVGRFYERLETHFKQILREGVMRGELVTEAHVAPFCAVMLAHVEGRISQFVRSGFARKPLEQWDAQWALLLRSLLQEEVEGA